MDSVLRFRTVPCVALNDADYSTWVWTPRRISCNKLSFFSGSAKTAPRPASAPAAGRLRSAALCRNPPRRRWPASRAARASRVTRTHAERYPLRKHVSVTKKVQDKPKIQKNLPPYRARSAQCATSGQPQGHAVHQGLPKSQRPRSSRTHTRTYAHVRYVVKHNVLCYLGLVYRGCTA